MNKTKIDWADMTWNPVTGCLNSCPYCFARKIAMRFCTNEHGKNDGILAPCDGGCQACSEMDGYEFLGDKIRFSHLGDGVFPYGFLPTFYRNRLDEPAKVKKPQTIFVCSMADLFGEWVPDKYIQEVFKACEITPQHRYLFLTKNPSRYVELSANMILPINHHNMWFGTTVTSKNDTMYWSAIQNTFAFVEPILGPLSTFPPMIDWFIVGAETGNRKGKVIPDKSWVMPVVFHCQVRNIPIFMKESLRGLMGDDFIQMYPWDK